MSRINFYFYFCKIPDFYIFLSVHLPPLKYGKNSKINKWMKSIRGGWYYAKCGWDLAERFGRLTVNAKVATVLGSIPASSDTVEYEKRQIKQCAVNGGMFLWILS